MVYPYIPHYIYLSYLQWSVDVCVFVLCFWFMKYLQGGKRAGVLGRACVWACIIPVNWQFPHVMAGCGGGLWWVDMGRFLDAILPPLGLPLSHIPPVLVIPPIIQVLRHILSIFPAHVCVR